MDDALIDGLISEAESWVEQDRYKKGIEYYQKAIDAFVAPDARRVDCYLEMGHLWRLLGNNRHTGQCYQDALKDAKAIYGDTPHITTGTILYSLGSFLEQIWKLGPSLDYYKQALKHLQQTVGESHKYSQATLDAISRITEKSL